MSVQSPPSTASSLLPPHLLSSNASAHQTVDECFRSTVSVAVFAASFVTGLLLLPLFLLILSVGLEQRSSLSHGDVFLFHAVLMNVHSFLGFSVFFFGGYVDDGPAMLAGLYVWTVTAGGQAVLHLLMCVERYFAVLRPVRYLEVRGPAGARLRNGSIGCVWLLCVGWAAVVFLSSRRVYLILDYILTAFHVLVVCFCSVSVLCVLKRPGPGEAAHRHGPDRTKRRAFHTIVAVMGALALRFSWNLINGVMCSSGVLDAEQLCVFLMSDVWFDLPSNLLLPLLFLQHRHKLPCCSQTPRSG